MRLPDLLTAARRVDRAPDIGDAEWIDYANEVLLAAAKAVFLPDLEASATVVVPAGATHVALPDDYQRHLWRVCNGNGGRLTVKRTAAAMRTLRQAAPEAAGLVLCAAAIGQRLEVWPAPEEDETLLLYYFRRPHALELVSGTVTFSGTAKTLTATGGERLFTRFRSGDEFIVSGSNDNNNAFTVVLATETTCAVAETVADETAQVGILAGTVEGVPEELHRTLVVAGMLAKAYDTGEDATEGKPNTDRYAALLEGLQSTPPCGGRL